MLALVGPRLSARLRAFMLTVVVVDDIVALLVIATAYTATLTAVPLTTAAGFLVAVLVLRYLGVRRGLAYAALGAGMWIAVFKSGVDPVIVGLLMGLLTYAYPAARIDLERATGPVPAVPRAADARARTLRPGRARVRDLAERAAAAPLPPVVELRDRPGLRAGERRHPDRRRLPTHARSRHP